MKLVKAQKFTPFPSSIIRSGLWAQLSASAKAVYVCLLDRSDGNTCKCWPSYATIAKDAGICRASAIVAVKELMTKELVIIEARHDDEGDQASNIYTMMVPDDEQEYPSVNNALGSPENRPPQSKNQTTGSPNSRPERDPIEPDPLNGDSPTGSAAADAPHKAIKPDVYQAVLEVYNLAWMPEPPKSEVGRVLKYMKEALSSGWDTQRIATAWMNARKHATNPHFWTLSYCLVHLTEAEAMTSRPGGKPPKLTDEELEARARANAQSVQGVLHNDR